MTRSARTVHRTLLGQLLLLSVTASSGCNAAGATSDAGPGPAQHPAGTPAALYAAAASTCANLPLRSKGRVFHFCDCQTGAEPSCAGHAGNDANFATYGCSEDHPCQTWAQAIRTFNAMNGGDTIALCRGGAWTITTADPADCNNNFTNTRCAPGDNLTDPANASTCDVRDYAPSWGGTARPLLALSGSNVRVINRFGGGVRGVRVLNLAFQGSNNGPNGGVYDNQEAFSSGLCNVSNDSHWMFCNDTFDRLRLAIHAANGSSTYSDFLIWGNRFTMNDLDAILSGNGDNNRIDANYFDDNGGWNTTYGARYAHTVYFAGDGVYNSTNLSFVNNEIRRTHAAVTPPGPSTEAIVVGHEYYDGVNIENNIIDCGPDASAHCWGIDLEAIGSPPTHYRNMVIHRNAVNAGGVGIAVGQAPGVIIENNLVSLTSALPTWKQGIATPQQVARTAANGGPDDVEDGAVIRNNTIDITANPGSENYTGIVVDWEGTGHVVANNAIQFVGQGGFGHCFSTPLAASAYAFVGNNACNGFYAWDWGVSRDDAATRVTAPALFVDPARGDFTPSAGSPLRGAGTATYGASVDFTNRARPAPPSIGAYEP